MTKRAQLNQNSAADVRAFNDEYAGYNAALKDYKSQSSPVEHLEADRLKAMKKVGQKLPDTPSKTVSK